MIMLKLFSAFLKWTLIVFACSCLLAYFYFTSLIPPATPPGLSNLDKEPAVTVNDKAPTD